MHRPSILMYDWALELVLYCIVYTICLSIFVLDKLISSIIALCVTARMFTFHLYTFRFSCLAAF